MQPTDNDCIASRRNNAKKTATKTHTLNCGRFGCPVVFIYAAGTDWPTINCFIDNHWLDCKGGFYRLSNSPPRSNTHEIQYVLSPPPLAPESLSVANGNQDEVSAGGRKHRKKEGKRKRELEEVEYTEDVQAKSVKSRGCKRRRNEDERKQELEEDEYTEDVQPKFVKCLGCKKAIKLDNRSMYYTRMWDIHRDTCPGIRKIEVSKFFL
jgi:hypothetical protein